MEPIINPLYFYWMSLLGRVSQAAIIFAVFSGIAAIVTAIWYMCIVNDDCYAKWLPLSLKWFKVSLIIFIITFVLAMAIPDKDTLIEMMVFKHVTPDNIAAATDSVKGIVDYIIETAAKVK